MQVPKLLLGATALFSAVAVLFLGSRFSSSLDGGQAKGAAPAAARPAMPVPVSTVVKKTIPIYLDYSARMESPQNVTLQARISGYLLEQAVPDGADVKAGDLLYKIDPRDYQAALDQMKAQAQRDSAALEYARSNLDRGTELARSGYLAKDTFDQRSSTLRQDEAAIAIDKAAIRTAELNVSYTEIRAPFAGRIGRHQAALGALVSPAGTILNTLVQLDPIYVTFNPSETDLAAIEKALASGKIEASILLPGENESRHKGTLSFLNNVIDQATGTVIARATLSNPDFALLPGQYVHVRLHLRDEPGALIVPQTALGSSQLGKYVYIVGKGNIAEQHLVVLGPAEGDLVTVVTGVAEGNQVINGNLQKIGPGAPVQPLPQPD